MDRADDFASVLSVDPGDLLELMLFEYDPGLHAAIHNHYSRNGFPAQPLTQGQRDVVAVMKSISEDESFGPPSIEEMLKLQRMMELWLHD